MTPEPQRGDLVNVEIKGVRMGESSHIRITVEDERGELWVLPPQSAITHAAPAEWPPRIDDLWRDSNGVVWFGVGDRYGNVQLTSSNIAMQTAEFVNQSYGPMTLVHREDEQGGGGS